MWLSQQSMFIVRPLPLTLSTPPPRHIAVYLWVVIIGFKGLMACCHSLFIFLIMYRTYIGTHINSLHSSVVFAELHSLLSDQYRGLQSRVQNRAWGLFAAAQRATVWALSHPDWATPHPIELRRTLSEIRLTLDIHFKKGLRFSRPQPGCHLPDSPWPGIVW